MDQSSGIIRRAIIGGLNPPPGVTPNFVNPPSDRMFNLVCQGVCLSTSTVFVLSRMFTKARITRSLGWDDYTCCVAWLGLIAYAVLSLEQGAAGLGIHQWNVTEENAIRYRMLSNAQEIIYGPLIIVTKVSILLLYSRLFAPRHRSRTYLFIALLLYFTVVFYTAVTFVKIFECTPRSKIWLKSVPGQCINLGVLLYVTGIVNVLSDIAILVLPLGTIWRLKMSIKHKVGVSLAFTAALFAPIASVFRLVTSIKSGHLLDQTYYFLPLVLWTEAEITTGIICSCLPTVPALFRHYVPKLSSRLASSVHRPDCRRATAKITKPSLFSSKGSQSTSHYHDPEDPRLLQGQYLELDEVTSHKGLDSFSEGPTTIIEGGVSNTIGGKNSMMRREFLNRDPLPPGEGILKTLCVETYPQPAPAAYHGMGTTKRG